ncbi:hypothetical protein TIFTF001_048877 [Ficus carica]|uniref:Uncharacterized protein n=1 Tax=Ficus carica TaxID=3494 RepID=A0AA87Z8V3_FICCA|nr:hypothetical protein TIFTF001_048877 [Ficus carica]
MPPVEDIDEFDDDVSHLITRRSILKPSCKQVYYTTGPWARRLSYGVACTTGPWARRLSYPEGGWLARRAVRGPVVAHFLLQAATNSVIAAAAANSVVPPPIHWCWSIYSSSKKIKVPPVWGPRGPPSGARLGARRPSGAPGAPRLAPVWGARRTSGAPGSPMARI